MTLKVMDGDYFTVMGLISTLNDLAGMSEQSQLIIHQGRILFTNIIYNSFDCWQSSANTSQASFHQGWKSAQLQQSKPQPPMATQADTGQEGYTCLRTDTRAGPLGFQLYRNRIILCFILSISDSEVPCVSQGDSRSKVYQQVKLRDMLPSHLNW